MTLLAQSQQPSGENVAPVWHIREHVQIILRFEPTCRDRVFSLK